LEERMRGIGLERQITELIDNQELRLREKRQPVLELVFGMGFGKLGDESLRGDKRDLLAEAFEVLLRGDYAILRILCGVAPVTRRSGKSRIVTRRLACNVRLRNAIHFLADAARRCDAKSKAKYTALKARGCSHARALRTIGDRLLYVACTMLKNGVPFDPCF